MSCSFLGCVACSAGGCARVGGEGWGVALCLTWVRCRRPISSPVAPFPPVGRGQWQCHVGPGQLWSLAGMPPSWQLAARGLAVSEINAQTSTIVQMSPFQVARALFFFLYCLVLLLLFFFFFLRWFFVSMLYYVGCLYIAAM